jgi:cytochrome P450
METIASGTRVEALLAELVSRAGRDDPYPVYAALRREAPVAQLADGALLLTRFDDCAAALRDPDIGHGDPALAESVGGLPDWREHLSLRQFRTSLLSQDPPAHTRLRRLVSGAFTPRRVAGLQGVIEARTATLLDQLADGTDFIGDFAFPLPIAVIGELLGVPGPDQAQFQHLAHDWTQVLDVTTPRIVARADAAAGQIRDYLGALAAQRRRQPRSDLLSAMVHNESDEPLTNDEILTMAALLFAAGFETTTHLLGNGLVALARNPDQFQALRRSPATAPQAISELVRYDSSVQLAHRKVLRDTVIGGVPVAAGRRVLVCLGAANHDPARFDDPGRLDLSRPDVGSISFGGGIHYCLGAPLARLEAQVALPAVIRRFPRLTVREPLHRRVSLTLRGFLRVPLTGLS